MHYFGYFVKCSYPKMFNFLFTYISGVSRLGADLTTRLVSSCKLVMLASLTLEYQVINRL